jgi:hypothetical protein
MIDLQKILEAIKPYVLGWTQPELKTWTPTWTNLTVTGAPIYTGTWMRNGRLVAWNVVINPNGGTTASTTGSTYINNFPFMAAGDSTGTFMQNQLSSVGGICQVQYSTTKIFTPTWAANGNYIVGSGIAFIDVESVVLESVYAPSLDFSDARNSMYL